MNSRKNAPAAASDSSDESEEESDSDESAALAISANARGGGGGGLKAIGSSQVAPATNPKPKASFPLDGLWAKSLERGDEETELNVMVRPPMRPGDLIQHSMRRISVASSDIRLPLGKMHNLVKEKVQRKRFARFVVSVVIYLAFIYRAFDVRESFDNSHIYRQATNNLQLEAKGLDWMQQDMKGTANSFKTTTLPLIIMESKRICPKCRFRIDAAFAGKPVSTPLKPISTDEDAGNGWQRTATLWIGRDKHELTIAFRAYAESPGFTHQIVRCDRHFCVV